jgi:hypothetical protein
MGTWFVTNSFTETAKSLGMPLATVQNLVARNKNKAEFIKLRNEKGEDFAAAATRIIEKALNRLEKEIDSGGPIPVNHLSTVVGTLFDKRALARGEATANAAIVVKLPEEMNEYAE